MVDTSIVIVSWNARPYVEECLVSLTALRKDISTEIIIVDNASTDGTADMIHRRFPQVRLFENASNLGFARANNIGIAVATGKYICLINPDVKVEPDCLSKLYHYMEQERTIGLLGPKMLGQHGDTRRSAMRFPTLWNSFLRAVALDSLLAGTGLFGGFLMTDFRFNTVRDVDVLNGWFWMARQEAVDEVGFLDERFFMYGEDIDWCKRFHSTKWRVVFYPDAEAIHYGGGSSSNAPVRFYVEMQRANLQYWKKHHGHISLFFYLLTTCLNHASRALGYGFLYLMRLSSRSEASFKIKRSYACILSLIGVNNSREATTQCS